MRYSIASHYRTDCWKMAEITVFGIKIGFEIGTMK